MKYFLLLVLIMCTDCNNSINPAGREADRTPAPILAPFQGKWIVSVSKTLANWQSAGTPADEIEAAKKMAGAFPLHPDMDLRDNIAVLSSVVEGEYLFFALHQHKQWVCGKAWHHEDRNDPGDMDKYRVRLELQGSDLLLSIRVSEDSADISDRDVLNTPLLADSEATCDADKLSESNWSPWRTYVFERPSGATK